MFVFDNFLCSKRWKNTQFRGIITYGLVLFVAWRRKMDNLFPPSPSLKKHIGKCALCGKTDNISYEHIPPKAAFNSSRAKLITLNTLLKEKNKYPWDTKGLPYISQQSGAGLFSLCEKCNNITGKWYGAAYQSFAEKGMGVVTSKIDDIYNSVEFKEVYPLKFFKQIISMFCSLNPEANIDDLRKFVLNRNTVGIDKNRYKICMYFTRSTTKRHAGLMATGNIQTGEVILFSEIVACPFGFLLYIDPNEKMVTQGFDITSLSDYDYDEMCNIKMPLIFKEVNTWMPYDYRSKNEIKKDIKETDKRLNENKYT